MLARKGPTSANPSVWRGDVLGRDADADALVLHREPHAAIGGTQRDRDRPLGLGVLRGVVEDVVQHASDEAGLDADGRRRFDLAFDPKTQHLSKPAFVGEISDKRQFKIRWKSAAPIQAQPWHPLIPENRGRARP